MSVSSVNIERFLLGAGENKAWETIKYGGQAGTPATGNRVSVELAGDVQPYLLSSGQVAPDPGDATVTLQSSINGTVWTTVATAVVKYRGQTSVQGNVGKYFRVANAGPSMVSVVVKPQVLPIQPMVLL